MEFGTLALPLLSAVATGVAGNMVYEGLKNPESLLPITNHRKKALCRSWLGSFIMPQSDGSTEEVDISMELSVKKRTIIGVGKYSDTELQLNGGFFRDDYFYLNYENTDKAIFQRGMMIFHWPNNPIVIRGKFLGIRRIIDEIASGDMVLKVQ